MKNLVIGAVLALATLTSTSAFAGKGGSAAAIRNAISSHSSDAIIAEVERAEGLTCSECVQLVTNLTADSRYEVREVAGWWFAKRPGLAKPMAEGFTADLASSDGPTVRNAADFIGSTVTFTALPALRAAIGRDVGSDAKLAIIRAVASMGHQDGAPALVTALHDQDAAVRAAAVSAFRELRDVTDGTPLVASLTDADASVRAAAATAVGAYATTAAIAQLESMVTADTSPIARRNAAWALGKLHSPSSRAALTAATHDASGLVRLTAKASLSVLH